MTGLWAAVLGAGVGVGVVITILGLRSRPIPLSAIQDQLDRPGFAPPREITAEGLDDWKLRLSRWATGLGRQVGSSPSADLAARLQLVGKTEAQFAYERMLAAMAGAIAPLMTWLIATAGGASLPLVAVLTAAVGCAVGGWLLPTFALASQVAERRRDFRHQLSAYLDLVVVILAGGGAVETALQTAAAAGDGWAFQRIRFALTQAASTRRAPWDTLAELGREIGITELRDLAANIALAGAHGARTRESLVAKADSLRTAVAMELEATATKRTEKMAFPLGILMLGMLLFIGYGAVEAISTPSDQFTPANNPPVESP